jgi:DNA modification methylase
MEFNKVYQGSCFDEIKQLPDNSIDLVVTSPPYCKVTL